MLTAIVITALTLTSIISAVELYRLKRKVNYLQTMIEEMED